MQCLRTGKRPAAEAGSSGGGDWMQARGWSECVKVAPSRDQQALMRDVCRHLHDVLDGLTRAHVCTAL